MQTQAETTPEQSSGDRLLYAGTAAVYLTGLAVLIYVVFFSGLLNWNARSPLLSILLVAQIVLIWWSSSRARTSETHAIATGAYSDERRSQLTMKVRSVRLTAVFIYWGVIEAVAAFFLFMETRPPGLAPAVTILIAGMTGMLWTSQCIGLMAARRYSQEG